MRVALLDCNRVLRGSMVALALIATFHVAQAAECSVATAGSAPAAAQEVIHKLYKHSRFVESRGTIDTATISELEPFLTHRLAGALRAFSEAVLKADQSADRLTKAPYPAGPIFLSNYEGMDNFRIAGASPAADQSIRVTVDMNFDSPLGSVKWADVAVLRCEGDRWKLDDIAFDPKQTAGPSLLNRIAVR